MNVENFPVGTRIKMVDNNDIYIVEGISYNDYLLVRNITKGHMMEMPIRPEDVEILKD